MSVFRIGESTIDRIEEAHGPGFDAAYLLPDWDPDILKEHGDWLMPRHYHARTGRFITSLHSWLVRTKHHTILVDTCTGNLKHRPHSPLFHMKDTPWLERLKAAGVRPEDVDFVMCTHLHVDHVGWNTKLENGRWVPTFPNAKYVFSKTERDFWDPEKNPGLDEEARQIFEDSVHPVIAAGQERLVSADDQLDDNLIIKGAPGHTPGQIMLQLTGGGQEGLFTGDAMHHPIQVYRPRWSSRFCTDPVQSADTREKILGHCADCNALMLPAHFGGTHAGRVKRKGDGFAFAFED
jgi:glyoxylase-like metal-dependent hydrolase (beta-lactamase superfamily II)